MTAELWGKWGRDGASRYPLQAHLLDTAAFAAVLCDRWVPDRLLVRAAAQLGTDRAGVVQLLVSAAGLHDLGKAVAVFQRQLLAEHPPAGIDQHARQLDQAGLVKPEHPLKLLSDDERRWVRRHEVAGAVLLQGRLDDAGAAGIASLVAGHHGAWDIPLAVGQDSTVCRYHDWLRTDPAWKRAREDLVSVLRDVAGVDPDLPVRDMACVPLLTGVVVLADWLASDLAERDPTVSSDWHDHYRTRTAQAAGTVDELLGSPSRPHGTFKDLFGFEPSRPVQQHLVRDAEPGLRIVAVPTGDGKTEAALGHWLLNADRRQGLFFALPTMATADAMFTRVRQMFKGTPTVGALAHGRSLLNEFYAEPDRPLDGETHDGHGGLAAGEWFHSNRRAVLAPIAVGTADQLVLAALRHRHNFLRMLGAATKTVVFDEVHSYDPYMASLLERFLVWAGEWQIDTVLLSATLPTERLEAYTRAYSGQGPPGDVPYPAVVTVPAGAAPQVAPLDGTHAARTVQLRYHRTDDPAAAMAAVVRDLRADNPHAKIGVITNTVKRCQQVAADLDGRTGNPALAGQLHVMHARFTADVRARQAADAAASYGKTSVDGPATMVATQVVEQSIDLDFDVLVTDLCPAPSLLQRLGRVHRHDLDAAGRRRARPSGCPHPTVHVIVPDAVGDAPAQLWPWLPYPAVSILRTWNDGLHRGARTELHVPDDVQRFVDASHVQLDELTTGDGLDHAAESELFRQVVQRQQAEQQAIPLPTKLRRKPERGLGDYASDRSDEDQLQTRWIERPSFDLLLCNGGDGTWQQPLPTNPDREQVRALLGCVVTSPYEVHATAELPAGWDRTLLSQVRLVDLTSERKWRLDPLLGFTRRKDTDV